MWMWEEGGDAEADAPSLTSTQTFVGINITSDQASTMTSNIDNSLSDTREST